MDTRIFLKVIFFFLILEMLYKTFKKALRDFWVILFLFISRESLNAMVWKMAALRLYTFERLDATVTTSSVSESGANIVMKFLRA